MAAPIIVIGASAGGVEALRVVVAGLAADLPSAVAVVLHIPKGAPSALPAILDRCGPLPARTAEDGMPLRAGTISVAPADHHLLVGDRCFELSAGPSENGHRPAIDPLFYSAALAHGPGSIGVVLSGARDDGTAGLIAISKHGGQAVVQDPADALHPSMPTSALHHVPDALVRPAGELGKAISELARSLASRGRDDPNGDQRLETETRIAEMDPITTPSLPDAHPSGLSCPTCHGVLYELDGQPAPRFRCRVGHAWSPQALQAEQEDVADHALWTALRTLEEKAEFNRRLAEDARRGGRSYSMAACLSRAARAEGDAAQVRQLLGRVSRSGADDAKATAQAS